MAAQVPDEQPTTTTPSRTPNPKVFVFILVTAFLNTMGFGLVGPVLPFLVQDYVSDPNALAAAVGWLASTYAICQFIAAPGLGALSDRYGRRPILLICLFGSAVGYLIFGIGGALWLLFLGRIIDGLTGGNISTIFAYIADISEPSERGKYYGRVGAVAGAGFIVGPVIGGLTAKLGYEAPFFFAAAIALINTVWGYFNLPESLDKQQRTRKVKGSQLNPFKQLGNVFTIPQLRWLLLATFLFSFPFAALTANLPVLTKDSLQWDADGVGVLFFLVGVVDIIVQGGLIGRLLPRFGEAKVAIGGMVCEIIGYLLLGAIAGLASPILAIAGTIIFAAGDGLIGPCLTGLISQAVGPREQGRVQGGNQSVQSLARAVGPFWGGEFYAQFGHSSPYWSGAVLVGLAIATLVLALPSINANTPTGTS